LKKFENCVPVREKTESGPVRIRFHNLEKNVLTVTVQFTGHRLFEQEMFLRFYNNTGENEREALALQLFFTFLSNRNFRHVAEFRDFLKAANKYCWYI
jgi:hypothetical protein